MMFIPTDSLYGIYIANKASKASVEGEALQALPVEGATQAP